MVETSSIPAIFTLPGRGVAAEGVKHPETDTDLSSLPWLCQLLPTLVLYVLLDGASHKNKSSKPLKNTFQKNKTLKNMENIRNQKLLGRHMENEKFYQ